MKFLTHTISTVNMFVLNFGLIDCVERPVANILNIFRKGETNFIVTTISKSCNWAFRSENLKCHCKKRVIGYGQTFCLSIGHLQITQRIVAKIPYVQNWTFYVLFFFCFLNFNLFLFDLFYKSPSGIIFYKL